MRYALLLATTLFLSFSSLLAQCPPEDFIFGDGMQIPRFRDAPISFRDQPQNSTIAFLPSDGIDRGEYGTLTGFTNLMDVRIHSQNTALTLRAGGSTTVLQGPTGTIDIAGIGNVFSEYDVYFEPLVCSPSASFQENGNNRFSVECLNCPELPLLPSTGTVDPYVVDSATIITLPPATFSNAAGAPELGESAKTEERNAWKAANNPFGNQRFLETVERSLLIPVALASTEEVLFVNLSDIEYNTTYYNLTGLADGFGASLVAYNELNDSYAVVDVDYFRGFSPNPESMQLSLDLTEQPPGTSLFVNVWRVSGIYNVNNGALGTFNYPSNFAKFDLRLRHPTPPPPAPPHDECADAKPVIYSSGLVCNNLDSVLTYAARESHENSGCFNEEVWLSFTAASTQLKFLAERTGPFKPRISLVEGGCDNRALIQCFFSQESRDTFDFSDLTIGHDYLIRVSTSFDLIDNSSVVDTTDNMLRYCLFGTPETCSTPQASIGETTCLDFQQYEFELEVTDMGDQPSLNLVQQNTGETLTTITATGTYLLGPFIGNNPIRLEGNNAICYGELIELNQFCGGEANDECSEAFLVPLSSPESPVVRRAWGRNATPSPQPLSGDCGANAGARDFWFSVVNTTGEVTDLAIVATEIDDFWAEHTSYFYNGSCNAPSYLTCNAEDLTIFNDVPAGDTIFVRSVKTIINNNNAFAGTSVFAYAITPPANAECDGAIPVNVSTDLSCTSSFTGDNTQTEDGKLWYSFQPNSGSVSLLLSSLTPVIDETSFLNYEIFSGPCGGLTLVASGNVAAGFPRQIDGLTMDQDYFLALQTGPATGRGQFEACLLTPPAGADNDIPDDAITVPVNTDGTCLLTTNGTTFGATGVFFSCAGGSRDDDVFFKFTASTTAYEVELNNVSLVQGTDPTAVIQVGRFDQFGGFSTAVCAQGNSVIASGLTVGEEYFISVYTSGSNTAIDFDLCVKEVPTPANDLCENALPLTPNTDQTCTIQASGSLAGADGEGFTGFFCGNTTPVDDVWYTFTAVAGVPYSLEVSDPGFAQRIQVYEGSCGVLSSIYCDNNQTFTVPPGVSNRDIYVRVFTFEFTIDKSFDLCLQQISGSAPTNQDCNMATSVPVSTPGNCNPVAGTTFLADEDFAPCFGGNAEADVYFQFVATESAHQVIVQDVVDVIGVGFATLGVEVYSGSCGSLVSLGCAQPFEGGASTVVSDLTPGETYFIRVFEHSGTAAADFNVCVQTIIPPANDEQAGAIHLLQELVYRPTSYTLEFATSSGPAVACNGNTGTANDDVWFTFVANTTDPQIEFYNNFFNSLVVEVYAPGQSVPLACYDPFTNFTNTLPLSSLTTGDEYRIRVYSFDGSSLTGEGAGGEIGVYGLPTQIVYATAEGFCTPLNTVTSTGSGQWVYLEAAGDLVAAVLDEEPMGQITTGVYGNSGSVRMDANGIPYLDRNLQIGVTQQPSQGSIQVALFFTQEELNNLSDAGNSITSLFEVQVSKFASNECGPSLPNSLGQLITPRYSSFLGNGGLMVVVDITDFSSFYLHSGPQPLSATALPVSCTDFTAEASDDGFTLSWTTAQEEDHANWIIETSNDGINWTNVTVIAGTPENENGGTYNYFYPSLSNTPTSYFRLLAEAYDGTPDQACSVQQVTNTTKAPWLQNVFPNPIADQGMLQVSVSLPEAASGRMEIFDLNGRSVGEMAINGVEGINQYQWQLKMITASGIYQLNVSIAGHLLTKRVVISPQ